MQLSGVWTSLLSPLDASDGVDHAALAKSVTDQIGHGVDGVVPLGTLGEFPEFDREERRAIVETVVTSAAGQVPVLAGVSGLSTRDTCRLAADAADAGVDGVLVLAPLYWKVSEARMFDHFRSVADAADRPVVLYDFPALTAAPLSTSLLQRIATEEPRIIGAKLTVRDIQTLDAAIRATRAARPDFAVVTGFEDLLPAALYLGADGSISGLANLVPDLLVQLVAAVRNNAAELPDLQRRVTELCDVYELTNPVPIGFKSAAHLLGRLPRPDTRINHGNLDEVHVAAQRWVERHQL